MMSFQAADILRILPEVVLSGLAVLVMVLEPFLPSRRKSWLGWVALGGVLVAGAATPASASMSLAFNRSVAADPFAIYFTLLVLLVTALTLLGSIDYLARDNIQHGEFYALLLMAAVGGCFMAASTELMMTFLGLEISSLSTYVLAGFKRTDAQSNEAAVKYFLLGSFATAFFLYGIAFVYGLTGTTNLLTLSERLASPSEWSPLALVAVILLFVGLAFKVSTVPFQIWTPDVYQGAPAPVTAFLSVGPKAAAFAVFLRIFLGSLTSGHAITFWIIWVSAALTMTVGNLAAIAQSNLKRLLAYSSIAHAGYILVGIAAAGSTGRAEGTASVLFYLAAYALMNLAAFVLVAHLAGPGERRTLIEDYVGLAYQRPGAAACLTALLLSLGGLPATAGFLAKFYVFRAAIHSHLIGLTIVAVLNSVVSIYYYLRPVIAMYMREGEPAASTARLPWPLRATVTVSLAGILYLGLHPNAVLSLVQWAASPLP